MIEKVIIKGLFGYQDYTLNLKDLDSINYLMITSPIGYGKSVILRMIRGALNYQKSIVAKMIFNRIPFSHFEIRDEKGNKIVVTKNENHSPVFMCDGFNLSARLFEYCDAIHEFKVDGTPQEKYVKWHFSDGKNNLCEDYYKRMLEYPSRGAKHLFELYDFLFNAKEDVLLIDTPEDNLHMVDIERLTRDIQELLNNSKKQIIVATHSPAFINGMWDNTIDLYTISKK